jgi:hypothetical protein
MCAAYAQWSVWVIAASPVIAAAIVLAVDAWA